jgi:fumarate reductase flavoprotein subunit
MKELNADIAVVGGGTAGMAAAVAAAGNGASVIVLEKASTTGGTGNMGMGLLAIGSRRQKLKGIKLTTDEAFRIHMNFTHWRVDPLLVRAFLEKSGSTADWLEDMGVQFGDDPHASDASLMVLGENGRTGPSSNATMMKRLTERARALGVKIRLRTTVKKILKVDGRVTGLIASDPAEEPIQVNAGAVIIGTGGFGDSPESIKKYTGLEWGKDIISMRIPGLVGEGIRMAWEAGAAPTDMTIQIIYGGGDPDLDPDISLAFSQPGLTVNLLGQRIINEDQVMLNRVYAGNAVFMQKNRCAFSIFDAALKQRYETTGIDFPSYLTPDKTRLENVENLIQAAIAKGNQYLFVADTMEELAAKTGVNPSGLQKTVEQYNAFCASGYDAVFNKNPQYLRPIRQRRFYAKRLFAGGYGSLGGVKVNYRLEAINREYEVIPGLYATGVDANTLYADTYILDLPGNTVGFALNSGRMAGENAAEYVKSLVK